jgi:hypothetical protein
MPMRGDSGGHPPRPLRFPRMRVKRRTTWGAIQLRSLALSDIANTADLEAAAIRQR